MSPSLRFVLFSWPGVYSYYGVNDVCGFGKPVLDWYRAWWGSEAGHAGAENRLVGYPAWSLAAQESKGGQVTIVALAAAATVQLAINGVPFGSPIPVPALGYAKWDAVPFALGNYSLTSYNANGDVLGTFVSVSAGAPASLAMEVEWPGSEKNGAISGGGRHVTCF